MARYKRQTLVDRGLLEHTLTQMMKDGLLRYDSDADMMWTLSPPSTWHRYWRDRWAAQIGVFPDTGGIGGRAVCNEVIIDFDKPEQESN